MWDSAALAAAFANVVMTHFHPVNDKIISAGRNSCQHTMGKFQQAWYLQRGWYDFTLPLSLIFRVRFLPSTISANTPMILMPGHPVYIYRLAV